MIRAGQVSINNSHCLFKTKDHRNFYILKFQPSGVCWNSYPHLGTRQGVGVGCWMDFPFSVSFVFLSLLSRILRLSCWDMLFISVTGNWILSYFPPLEILTSPFQRKFCTSDLLSGCNIV